MDILTLKGHIRVRCVIFEERETWSGYILDCSTFYSTTLSWPRQCATVACTPKLGYFVLFLLHWFIQSLLLKTCFQAGCIVLNWEQEPWFIFFFKWEHLYVLENLITFPLLWLYTVVNVFMGSMLSYFLCKNSKLSQVLHTGPLSPSEVLKCTIYTQSTFFYHIKLHKQIKWMLWRAYSILYNKL